MELAFFDDDSFSSECGGVRGVSPGARPAEEVAARFSVFEAVRS